MIYENGVIKDCKKCVNCIDYGEDMDCEYYTICSDYSHFKEKENDDLEIFRSITNEMIELYKIKNKNYGNSFSEQFTEYGLTSVCIRLDDKIRRLKSLNKQMKDIENGICQLDNQGESIRDTLIDLANYSVLALMELDKGDK